jgi:hypothetical protein
MISPDEIDLPAFLTEWHGPPTGPVKPLPSSCSWLPTPLKDWYELSSQRSTELVVVKEMITPSDIHSDGHVAVFMEDHGDHEWAFGINSPDKVFERESDDPWEELSEPLGEFLIHNAVHEAAYASDFWRSCTQVPDSKLPEILAPMQMISFNDWNWPRPKQRIFMGDGLLANIGPAMEDHSPWRNRVGYVEVQAGATDPAHLEYLDSITEIQWTRPAWE